MISTQTKTSKSPEKTSFNLVQNDFQPKDGLELINCILKENINALKIKNLQLHVNSGMGDNQIYQSIDQLAHKQQYIRDLAEMAEKSGKKLRIHTTIDIELI